MFKLKEEKVKCSEIRKLLSPYQDCELEKIVRIKVKEHLRHCSECGKLFDELENVINGIKSIDEVVPDENYTGRVMANVLDYEKAKRSFSMTFVYTFVFTLFFLFGIFFSPFLGNGLTPTVIKSDISSFFLKGQKFKKSDSGNSAILQFQRGLDEKKVN